MLTDDQRSSGKVRYLKIVADSPWSAVCKVCKQKVIWARTVTNPRWVLFDVAVQQIQDQADENGTYVNYWPSTLVHWNTCVERQGGQDAALRSQRPENVGGCSDT